MPPDKMTFLLLLLLLLLLSMGAAPAAAAAAAWWRPNTTSDPGPLDWNYQLSAPLAADGGGYLPGVAVYIADCFDTPAAAIAALRARAAAVAAAPGARAFVIGYFSAGSHEDWRPDARAFAAARDLGAPLAGWPGERWVNTTSPRVREAMRARLRMCKAKGFDGVDPDNVNAHINGGGGIGTTAARQLAYTRFIADEAHALGLAVGLKNAMDQLPLLLGDVDFFVNEQCHEFDECGTYAPALAAGKPVFVVEYDRAAFDRACRAAAAANGGGGDGGAARPAAGLYTIFKNLTLDVCRQTCGGRGAPECPAQVAGMAATDENGGAGKGTRAGLLAALLAALVASLALG